METEAAGGGGGCGGRREDRFKSSFKMALLALKRGESTRINVD